MGNRIQPRHEFRPGAYGLEPGLYTFAMSGHGWELYHNSPTVTPPAPVNPRRRSTRPRQCQPSRPRSIRPRRCSPSRSP